MKLLYKYYTWRANRMNPLNAEQFAKQTSFRIKAYKFSPIGRLNYGADITGTGLTKQDVIDRYSGPENGGGFPPGHPKSTITGQSFPHKTGRYLDGPFEQVRDEETGALVDVSEWKETPQWWADVPEANQQHMPTFSAKSAKSIGYRLDPETKRRIYITYNYSTGKQEDIK